MKPTEANARRCEAIAKGGAPCKRLVRSGETLCLRHGGAPSPTPRKPKAAAVALPPGLEPRVSSKQLYAALGITAVTGWRWRNAGKLPPPDFPDDPRHPYKLATAQRIVNGAA
jgi:hypothetical protein